ncbi:hypothetical protein BOTBODRAFT_149102 [Botryobasidium botryosum FD-172 SS1]|uniref:Uncharacterized protein n=1 Tax=Botryobasidium botryosum (strain FD-172 SS1) TaxID=930990 RepID=A0A067LWB5_BOTB1|nr:hypothetical protein BOTBODRAFT_149102 [Botryobasidium botryosum FD-172 SS1]
METSLTVVDKLLCDIFRQIENDYPTISAVRNLNPEGTAFAHLEDLFERNQVDLEHRHQLYALALTKFNIAAQLEAALASKTKDILLSSFTDRPIARLPCEVASRVFELATLGSENPYFGLILAKVCKQWRMIALSTPSIWGAIDPRSVRTFLPRSKQAPLRVTYQSSSRFALTSNDFMKEIITTASRWTALTLESREDDPLPHLPIPAPRLQALRLIVPGTFRYDSIAGVQLLVSVPLNLYDLQLAGICPRLDAPLFRHLIRLHLERVRFHVVQLPAELLFRAIASASAGIEEVSLAFISVAGVSQLDTSQATMAAEPTQMPRLRILRLNTVHRCIVRIILASIAIPPSLQFVMHVGTNSNEDVYNLFPLLPWSGEICIPNLCQAQELTIGAHLYGWSMRAWNRERAEVLDIRCRTSSSRSFARYVDRFGYAIPVPPISVLCVSGFGAASSLEMDISQFTAFLSRFPSITDLTFVRCSPNFIATLQTRLNNGSFCCPKLHHLRVENCDGLTEGMLYSTIKSRVGQDRICVLDLVYCPRMSKARNFTKLRRLVDKINHRYINDATVRAQTL